MPAHPTSYQQRFLRFGSLFWIAMIVVSGCELFETRPAEPPDTGNVGVFLQPDRPEVVLDNLISAVENLNPVNYSRCLISNGYRYNPSNSALNSSPEMWANWSIDDERTYFNNLRAAATNSGGHRLALTNISTELSSNDSRQVFANYTLTVLHNRTNLGVPTTISGTLALRLQLGEDGLWSIREWTDISSGGEYSWSDLKAAFYRD
jgi:hypothetical protein